MKIEKDVNELSGSLGKRNFSADYQHFYVETVYVFILDAVQKTIKSKKNVNELSGSPGKNSFEYYGNTPRDT